jgi:hypothetical protein
MISVSITSMCESADEPKAPGKFVEVSLAPCLCTVVGPFRMMF